MLNNREKTLKQAKQILSHPNFPLLSPEQMQDVYRNFLAAGLTKPDIAKILEEIDAEKRRYENQKLNVSKLELLPRVVFKRLVEVGEIKGKDLVHLCNSSPILKNYCLADAKDVNGRVTEKEEIYALALKRALGKDYVPAEKPSEVYAKLTGGYIVLDQDIQLDNIRGQLKQLTDPSYIKQVSFSARNFYCLDINGRVTSKSSNLHSTAREVKNNIIKIAGNELGLLMMDYDRDLWYTGSVNRFALDGSYGDGSNNWDHFHGDLFRLPRKFRVKDGNEEFEIDSPQIRQISSDNQSFYFLTKEGNLWKSNGILRLIEYKMDVYYSIYVDLIESGIKYFEPGKTLSTYNAIAYDNTIIIDTLKHGRRTYRIPTNEPLVKVKETADTILALDSVNRLWLLSTDHIWRITEENVIDFDLYRLERAGSATILFVKTNMKVYRRLTLESNNLLEFYNGRPIKKIKASHFGHIFGYGVLMFSPILG